MTGDRVEELHHEKIHERSSKHGWDIQQHRHKNLAQVFLFRTKGVFIRVGDIDFQTTQPTALFVPPMTTHGFRFPENIEGDVISFPGNLAADLTAARILTENASEQFRPAIQIVEQLTGAYQNIRADRSALLSHLVQILLIYLRDGTATSRTGDPISKSSEMTIHEQQAHAFCAQIEQAFSTQKSVDAYAKDLGVSSPHLTRVSKKVLYATPNELITRRRMIEAERLLKFTRHSIANIAQRAGYNDAPFFNRTFKRRHGMSPGAFRKANVT